MTGTGSILTLPAALALVSALALAPAVASTAPQTPAAQTAATKRALGDPVHKGNYTCFQGGLTGGGSLYWGYIKVKRGNTYEIPGSKGKLRRKGKRLIFLSGSVKRWKWKGRYRTSRTGAGKKQWHIFLIDRPNGIKISCHDG